jgi:hypothetical protein
MSAPFQPGQRVKPSEYSLRPARDSWLRAGSSQLKTAYLDKYEKHKATMGTVVSCEKGKYGYSVRIKTDSGSIHDSMPGLWEIIKTTRNDVLREDAAHEDAMNDAHSDGY